MEMPFMWFESLFCYHGYIFSSFCVVILVECGLKLQTVML